MVQSALRLTQLRSLTIPGTIVPVARPSARMWPHLTELCIASSTWATLNDNNKYTILPFHIISACSSTLVSLQWLTFTRFSLLCEYSFPSLTELRLAFAAEPNWGPLRAFLRRLPALRILAISPSYGMPGDLFSLPLKRLTLDGLIRVPPITAIESLALARYSDAHLLLRQDVADRAVALHFEQQVVSTEFKTALPTLTRLHSLRVNGMLSEYMPAITQVASQLVSLSLTLRVPEHYDCFFAAAPLFSRLTKLHVDIQDLGLHRCSKQFPPSRNFRAIFGGHVQSLMMSVLFFVASNWKMNFAFTRRFIEECTRILSPINV